MIRSTSPGTTGMIRPRWTLTAKRFMRLCVSQFHPRWLDQQHGARVIDPADANAGPQADGACTSVQGVVCAVLTADCLPVLLCDRDGTRVAALHCGWRGIARGIIEAGIAAMQRPPSRLLAWLGPAIGPAIYEVGEEVREALTTISEALAAAFQPTPAGHWTLDLTGAARILLEQHGVSGLYGGEHCTYTETDRFFSHRRDGLTGRMATCIWREVPARRPIRNFRSRIERGRAG